MKKGIVAILFHLEAELAEEFAKLLKENGKTKREVLNDLIRELLKREGFKL